MNQTFVNDEILLSKSGYEYSPYISFKNPHIKKATEALEKSFLSGKDLPEMITNGIFGLLNYPLDLLNGYFKHLDAQKAEKGKALQNARANWDAEQLKTKNLTTAGLFSLLTQTIQASQSSVPELLQKRYPDFYKELPKDKNNAVLGAQLTTKQKKFIAKVSEQVIMDDFRNCLNQTFGRKLASREVKNYQNAIEKMRQPLKKTAKENPFIQTISLNHQR